MRQRKGPGTRSVTRAQWVSGLKGTRRSCDPDIVHKDVLWIPATDCEWYCANASMRKLLNWIVPGDFIRAEDNIKWRDYTISCRENRTSTQLCISCGLSTISRSIQASGKWSHVHLMEIACFRYIPMMLGYGLRWSVSPLPFLLVNCDSLPSFRPNNTTNEANLPVLLRVNIPWNRSILEPLGKQSCERA